MTDINVSVYDALDYQITIVTGMENLGGVLAAKEDVANKEDTIIDTSTSHYPTVRLMKEGLDAKSDTTHNHTLLSLSEKSYNSLTDKPTIPTALSSLTKDINFDERYYTETEANSLLAGKSDTTHNHSLNNLTEKSYNSLTDKPDLTSLHSHSNKSLLDTYTQTEVDIADAISKEHTHANKTDLDNYNPSLFAAASHAHAIGDVTSLQTTLDLKAPLASPTFTGTVTLPSTTSIGNISATEINYLDNVTSNVQVQLDAISKNIDCGSANSTYLSTQIIDLGNA